MLCTRVAVLQRKENVQIQISHSRCKRKKKNCEDKITGCPLTKCCISSSYYVHKKNFVPKCNKPDRENGEIQEKDWREQLIWGSIFLLSVHGLWRSERAWAATAKEETWVRSNNLVDIPCVISPLCKICCSILHVICAEHRWGGGKEKKRTEMGELWGNVFSSWRIRWAAGYGQQGKWMTLWRLVLPKGETPWISWMEQRFIAVQLAINLAV